MSLKKVSTYRNHSLIIVQGESLMVCAPTSAGKTFISQYTIDKVLTESGDKIVVFVCPTKSLVNQTYVQIISNPKYAGEDKHQPLAGIFTGENRIDERTCRILVTVPECLNILLLAPTAVRIWK